MKELRTEIIIQATAEHVHDILTDVNRYAEWNPFIVSAHGTVEPGQPLNIVIRPPRGKTLPYRVTVIRCIRPREFVWLGHLKVPGVLDGTHIFEIETEGPGRVRLIHREEFRGVLAPFVWGFFLNTRMREGFALLNAQLKKRAEHRAAGGTA